MIGNSGFMGEVDSEATNSIDATTTMANTLSSTSPSQSIGQGGD